MIIKGVKILLALKPLLPHLWELVGGLLEMSPEEISLNSDNKFRKLGDAKNEKDRVSALRDIQHLIRKS